LTRLGHFSRPRSSRKTWSRIAIAPRVGDRTAHAGRRDAPCKLERRVEIVGLEHEEAAQRLLDGDERTVGSQCLGVLHADRGCRLGWLQPKVGGVTPGSR
jgi:hypothetical protein